MSAPSAFRSVVRKARKTHKCCECDAAINIGDQYQYSSGVWDGEPRDYKQCLGCGVIFKALSDDSQEVCFGHLTECLHDLDYHGYQSCRELSGRLGIDSDFIAHHLKIEVVA